MQFQSLCPIFPAKDLRATQTFYEATGFCAEGLYPKHGDLRLPEVDILSEHLSQLEIPEDQGIPLYSKAQDTPWRMRETVWIDPNRPHVRAGAFPENG